MNSYSSAVVEKFRVPQSLRATTKALSSVGMEFNLPTSPWLAPPDCEFQTTLQLNCCTRSTINH